MVFPMDVLTRMASGDTDPVFTPFAKFSSEIYCSDMTALNTDAFVSLCSQYIDGDTGRRLIFYDKQGNVTTQKGGYYRTPEMTFPRKMDWHAFDGRLISRADGKRIVVTNLITDQIEIYDGQGDLVKLIKGPDHFDPDVVDLSKGNMTSYGYGEKARTAYVFPLAKKNSFWAKYYGTTFDEIDSGPKSTVMLSFDWDGKPLDKYIIQANIVNFDVDESRGLIYGIIMTEEGEQKIIKAKYK